MHHMNPPPRLSSRESFDLFRLPDLKGQLDGVTGRVRRAREEAKVKVRTNIDSAKATARKAKDKAVGEWRQAVTGTTDTKVRDHVRARIQILNEKLEHKRLKPSNARMFDRYTFTLGVMLAGATEYCCLVHPTYLPLVYLVLYPTVYLYKWIAYVKKGWQGFLLDFCYYANCWFCVFLLLWPKHCGLGNTMFIWAHGPLVWAIPLWKNSIVWHDIEKLTSILVHALPMLVFWVLRWFPSSRFSLAHCPAVGVGDISLSLTLYCIWQILYLLVTEVVLGKYLDAHPELFTSLRWLVRDVKGAPNRGVLQVCRKLKLMGRTELFSIGSLKTTFIFCFSQLLFTLITTLPTLFIGGSYWLHCAFLVAVCACAVHNGASFYMEVFSRRYIQGVDKKYTDFMAGVNAAGRFIEDPDEELSGFSSRASDTQNEDASAVDPDAPPPMMPSETTSTKGTDSARDTHTSAKATPTQTRVQGSTDTQADAHTDTNTDTTTNITTEEGTDTHTSAPSKPSRRRQRGK